MVNGVVSETDAYVAVLICVRECICVFVLHA